MTPLVDVVRTAIRSSGDPARAVSQAAYMKSTMPYAGLTVPEMRRIVRQAAREHALPDEESWRTTVLTLWREADVREERYAAAEVAGLAAYRTYATHPGAIEIFDEMIVTGAWWDHVDEAATHLVGPLLLAQPAEVTPVMRAWSTDADRWRRRSSVICQVGAKDRTDVELLRAAIVSNLDDRDFFLGKAIGWALRQHARIDPRWVRDFVAERGDSLSPLSRREALRRIGPG